MSIEKRAPKKHKLSEDELKALLGKTCRGKEWFLMKKSADLNKLALFLKINGADRIELGQKAYTYEVDLKDETIAGAFILTEKPGRGWYIAAMTVAPDYRGHNIGNIMIQKMRKLAKDEGADSIKVDVPEDALLPDAAEDIEDARSFWVKEGFEEWENGLFISTLAEEK